jgi:hypothetical protein
MAKRIYQDLKRYGLDVWFDNESLLPGQGWENEIEKAIEASKYFLVLLSSKGMSERGYVHKEIRLALNIFDRCPEDEIFMIPIRLDDCQPAHRRIKKINWINLFPDSEYQNGLKKMLHVVSPGTFLLRSKAMELSEVDANEMIIRHGFFEVNRNPGGKGFSHKYKLQEINGDKIIFDEISCLMWQQNGSSETKIYKSANEWVKKLNRNRFAGFNDWRLPTLEEAMSLMEPEKMTHLYINPIFHHKQERIWTADLGAGAKWVVYFTHGRCFNNESLDKNYVRAVRSRQPFSK